MEERLIQPVMEGTMDAKRDGPALAAAAERERVLRRSFRVLGHELANPLLPLMMDLDLLKNDPDIPQHLHPALDRMERQVRRIRGLVEEARDAARLQEGGIALQRAPLRLDEVMQGAAGSLLHWATQRQIEMDLELAPVVCLGDPRRLDQVCVNLLSNAIKFSHAGGRIVARTEVDDAMAILSIEDTCGGIPATEAPTLFEPFQRLHGKDVGGTGLGLFIVRQLVEAMQGSVHVDPAARGGAGCRFEVRMPR